MGHSKQIFTDMNILVDGIGNVGISSKFELPKIEFLTIASNGAMSYDEVIPLLKAMSAKITLNEWNPLTYAAMGGQFNVGSLVICKGSTVQDGKAVPVLATIGGKVKIIENKIPDRGKEVEAVFEIAITSYSLLLNNVPVVMIDVKNMICMIGGNDLMSDLRSHIL
jgi:P2 family phage contractile tail tube protein